MPEPTPISFPGVDMSRFGTIDPAFGGGNRYRVIWSESRYRTFYPDSGPVTIPLYMTLEPINPSAWVIEKWQSAEEMGAGTEAEYNSNSFNLAAGPYPANGEYFYCETFSGRPTNHSIETVINAIEEGRKRRAVENRLACVGNMEKDAANRKNTQLDMLDNCLRPFGGGETFVGYGGARNSKTMPELLTAEQVGLANPGAMKVRR